MGQNRIAFIYLAIVLVLIGLLGQSQLIGLSLVQNKILENDHFHVSNRFFGEDSGVGDIGNFRERMDIVGLDYHMSVFYAMDQNFTSHFQIFHQNFTYVIINVFNRLMNLKPMNGTEVIEMSKGVISNNETIFGVMFVPQELIPNMILLQVNKGTYGQSTLNKTLIIFPWAHGVVLYTDHFDAISNEIGDSISLFSVSIKLPIMNTDDLEYLNSIEISAYNDIVSALSMSSFNLNLLIVNRRLRDNLDKIESGAILGSVADEIEDSFGFLNLMLIFTIFFHVLSLTNKSRIRDILMKRGSSSSYIFKYFFKPTRNTFLINYVLLNLIITIVSSMKIFTPEFISLMYLIGNILLLFMLILAVLVDYLYLRFYTNLKNYFEENREINSLRILQQFLFYTMVFGTLTLLVLYLMQILIPGLINPFGSSSSLGNVLFMIVLMVTGFLLILKKSKVTNRVMGISKKIDFDVFSLQYKRYRMVNLIFPLLLILSLSTHAISFTGNDASLQQLNENEQIYYFGEGQVFTDDLGDKLSDYIKWVDEQDIISEYGFVASIRSFSDQIDQDYSFGENDLHVIHNAKYFIDDGNITDRFFSESAQNLLKLEEEPLSSISVYNAPLDARTRQFYGTQNGRISLFEIKTSVIDTIKFDIPGIRLSQRSLIVGSNTVPLSTIGMHIGRLFLNFMASSSEDDKRLFFAESLDKFGKSGVIIDESYKRTEEDRENLSASTRFIKYLGLIIAITLIFIHAMIMISEEKRIVSGMRLLWHKGYSKREIKRRHLTIGLTNQFLDLIFVLMISTAVIINLFNRPAYSSTSEWVTLKRFFAGGMLWIFLGTMISYSLFVRRYTKRIE